MNITILSLLWVVSSFVYVITSLFPNMLKERYTFKDIKIKVKQE